MAVIFLRYFTEFGSFGGRACERSRKRSEAGRKSGGWERSVERAWQKTMERERSEKREVAERERSLEWSGLNRPVTLRLRSAHMFHSYSNCIKVG